ncbi:hypothetical protein [Streptomyces sp. NBC_00162]|uniref:hypothetical protein n=1 Tax=Streptomyces sp. NBC_00162 TaxID=2903629 RepID=UPI00214C2CEF|nr:hypothetical protein [Streptomyces sp. NBC_00162]UUU45183.1 hypothetical protein JIW86_41380 [Streptomyces sp. NBC_00162]
MSGGAATHPFDWFSIRSWAGSQDRAFEELCFQLRDAAQTGWRTVKTAAPDGGVEWYDEAPDGRCHGHQVKFVKDVHRLLPLATESVAAVGRNRGVRNVVRLTFWVPFDLPDPAHKVKGKPVQGARQRWNKEVAKWKSELPGVADIEIDLMDSGHTLERLLEPGNEGRRWFFFEQRALGLEWLLARQRVAETIAHDRYTPQHHVALPIASVIDGCAMSPMFRARLEAYARDLVEAMPGEPSLARVLPAGLSEAGSASFADLYAQMSDRVGKATEGVIELLSVASEVKPGWMPASDMADVAAQVALLLSQAQEAGRQMEGLSDEAARSATTEEREAGSRGWSREDTFFVDGARRRAEKLRAFCLSDAARAAEARRWVLLGEAGQGKTHLLVDATRRALKQGRPSLTVFAERLTAVDPLTQIAQHLGLGALPHEVLLQAMDAAGAASGARFMLFIDALNDSDEPGGWRTALPALAAEMDRYDHVALVVSCRSSLARAVLPDDLRGRGFPVTEHPGFAGHEVEALEAYLREAPSALPRTPMLTPAFSNPLFVKLYSDTVLSLPEGKRHTATTTLHRSAVFDAFVDRRAGQISGRLSLDPAERSVHQAVQKLAAFMAAEGREVVSHTEARTVVDSFAPGRMAWPDTMLGQLVAHGVLATDRYMHSSGTLEAGIGFAYQAFSDDRIVRAVLDQHREDVELAEASGVLQAASPVRAWLAAASGNIIDAATVLLPEATGHELIDLLADEEKASEGGRAGSRGYALYRSVVHTLGLRKGDHVTQRTVDLLNEATTEWELEQEVLEAVLSVATHPGHRLNADRLHRILLSYSPADRDCWWGIYTYSMVDETSALHRLLRWAEQLPTPDRVRPLPTPATTWVRRPGTSMAATGATQEPSEEVARLAAVTLVWTFTSPNRFLRDRATKAVVQLLLGYPNVVAGLLDQFLDQDAAQVDDPYLFERLVLAAYGALARTDAPRTQPELLARIARRILDSVYGDTAGTAHASRNVLLCDAATRIVRMAHRTGTISDEDETRTHHPHACPEVGEAPDENTLDARYPNRGGAGDRLWASLRSSFTGLADFTTYEVRPAVDHFSDLPLATPRPPLPESVALVQEAVTAFRDCLPEAVRDVLASDESIRALLKNTWQQRQVLNEGQQQLLAACAPAPTLEQELAAAAVDKEWAGRWILDNAVGRGWTPERFGTFDDIFGRGRDGREAHKAERFGKKYAWQGLHELVERLANHRHMKHGPTSEFAYYPGATALFLTDIDPLLPPAPHPLSEPVDAFPTPDEDTRHDTFRPTVLDNRWNPPAPSLPARERFEEWLESTEDLPNLAQLGARTLDDADWIVLNEYASDHAPGKDWTGQAEQWHIMHSWLVDDAQHEQVMEFLKPRSLMGRWMPEPVAWRAVYLGELPLPEDDTDGDNTLSHTDYTTGDTESPTAPNSAPETTGSDDDSHTAADPSRLEDEEILNLLDLYKAGRDKTILSDEDRLANLYKLGVQWSELPPSPAFFRRFARTTDGSPLRAYPASQEYSWSSSGHDCSIEAPAGLTLPCTRLMNEAGLRRDPDNGNWHTSEGHLVVQALRGTRPTGTISTLLVRRDWLTQRLEQLQMRLVLGMFGERQPRTSDRLRTWREYSQTALLPLSVGDLAPSQLITWIRRNPAR